MLFALWTLLPHTFLGHHITPQRAVHLAARVDRVIGFPRPHARKSLQKFLGMVNFDNHFLPYVWLMCPLYVSLQGKGASKGTHTALLAYPLPNAPVALTIDALNFAVWAVGWFQIPPRRLPAHCFCGSQATEIQHGQDRGALGWLTAEAALDILRVHHGHPACCCLPFQGGGVVPLIKAGLCCHGGGPRGFFWMWQLPGWWGLIGLWPRCIPTSLPQCQYPTTACPWSYILKELLSARYVLTRHNSNQTLLEAFP